jgi:3-phosphoshikimate 1-carboxyvinyltransferase
METLQLIRKNTRIAGQITLPLSKSIVNRLLVLGQLSQTPLVIDPAGQADDVVRMIRLLQIMHDYQNVGSEGICELDCGNAGTVFRFLTAVCALEPGNWLLSGSIRMQERPVGLLVEALQRTGARIHYTGQHNYPPLLIDGGHWKGGDIGAIRGNISSQFMSALLLAGAFAENGIEFRIAGDLTSKPYLDMTESLIRKSGLEIYNTNNQHYKIPPSAHLHINTSAHQHIEPDWSSASYFYSLAALSDEAKLLLNDLHLNSLQGDSIIAEIFADLGVVTVDGPEGIYIRKSDSFSLPARLEYDLRNYPDIAPTLAVCCAGLGLETRLYGLESLKIKESNRLEALCTELLKVGIASTTTADSILIPASDPKTIQKGVSIHTYRDHRIAMAFAPLALVCGEIRIEDPGVVDKSFPDFWTQFLQKTDCF